MDQHLLSIVLLTPLAGLAVLLFIPVGQQGPDPHLGQPGGFRRVPGFAAAGLALPDGRPRLPVRGARRLDSRAGRALSHRHRRHQPAAGDAHHADGLHRHALLLERHSGPRQGILRHVPAAADGHDRRIPLARFLPVLHLLGTGAGAHVLHHRSVGRSAEAVRGHQVLPVHAGRLGADAAGHPDALLPARPANSTSTPSKFPT